MDWLRSCLPTCLQWQRHQADTEASVELVQTAEEINASSRLLDALGGGTSTKWTPAMLTADPFVNICIEAVQHEVKRKLWDEELQKLETSATWHRTEIDQLAGECTGLAACDIPELVELLEEKQQLLASHYEPLRGLSKQIQTIKDDRDASIRTQKRLLGRLYNSSQSLIDAVEISDKIGKLEGTYQLCCKLTTSAILKTAMDETRVQTMTLQQAYIDASRTFRGIAKDTSTEERERLRASYEEAKAKWHDADCQLSLQTKAHHDYESKMLLDHLLPLLVKQGLYPDPFSPTTSTNGHELDLVQDHERQRGDYDDIHILAGQGREFEADAELLHKIRRTKNSIGKSVRRLERKRKARLEGLAGHLLMFPNATVESFDEWYTVRNNNRSFVQSRNESLQWIDDKQNKYRSLLTKAGKQSLEDLPLPPLSFADRTDDGENSTVGRDLELGKTREGILKQRKIRRWQRGVARGFETISMSSSRSSRSSQLPPDMRSLQNRSEISDVVGRSNKEWLKRYEQRRERLRQSGKGRELQDDEDRQKEVYDAQAQLIDASSSIKQ